MIGNVNRRFSSGNCMDGSTYVDGRGDQGQHGSTVPADGNRHSLKMEGGKGLINKESSRQRTYQEQNVREDDLLLARKWMR